jgi:hypothetical protein
MTKSGSAYADLSDRFLLNVVSKLAQEFEPIFRKRHYISISDALLAIISQCKRAEENLVKPEVERRYGKA